MTRVFAIGINSIMLFSIVIVIGLSGCAKKPYANGPVMSTKDVTKTFQPILKFMDYKQGMTFADVGAGSGALSVMMAALMDSSKVYIQDIDKVALQQSNLDKIIDYYSRKSHQDLRKKNSFYRIIGDEYHSNLPDLSFDLIYSNATVHAFSQLDSMLIDLRRKLKPNGVLFMRDGFKNDHGAGSFCSDPKCAKPLLTIDEFLVKMNKYKFKLVKRVPDMSGRPVFGFALAD